MTMDLYYIPAACSLAAHISCLEAGIPTACHLVTRGPTGSKVEGEDFTNINPLGLVPTIVDGDMTLTESAIVLQYIADKANGKLGKVTGDDRWKLLETLNFLATEVHKSLAPLFRPDLPVEARSFFINFAMGRMSDTQNLIGRAGYLVGDSFTVADAYLFTLLGWCTFLKFDMSPWPKLEEYAKRIGDRPSVRQALKEEGLV